MKVWVWKVGENAREEGTLRKICSLKISICKCDTAGALHGSARLAPRLVLDLHFALYIHILCLPLSFFRRRKPTETDGNACGVARFINDP